jgi:hypothetical protein
LSGVRRSSGDPKLFFTAPAIVILQVDVTLYVHAVVEVALALQIRRSHS